MYLFQGETSGLVHYLKVINVNVSSPPSCQQQNKRPRGWTQLREVLKQKKKLLWMSSHQVESMDAFLCGHTVYRSGRNDPSTVSSFSRGCKSGLGHWIGSVARTLETGFKGLCDRMGTTGHDNLPGRYKYRSSYCPFTSVSTRCCYKLQIAQSRQSITKRF